MGAWEGLGDGAHLYGIFTVNISQTEKKTGKQLDFLL